MKLAYYSFNYLLNSIDSLKRDVDLQSIKLSERIAILTLIAFTYESFLNHAGDQAFRSWSAHMKKKLSPEGKLALLCEICQLEASFGSSPFQTFKEIMSLRNKLAHAETEYLEISEETRENRENWPKPDWIKTAETLDIDRALNDLNSIISLLQRKMGIPTVPSFLYMEAVNV